MSQEHEGDELLAELGALARAEAPAAEHAALLAGTLSDVDRARLRRAAAEDPAVERALAAFEPLDEAAQDRIADHLLSRVIPKASEPPARTATEGGARVVPLRRPPRWLLAMVPLAAAAALVVFVLRSSPTAVDGPAVPDYTLAVEGGEKLNRSSEPVVGPPRLLPDSRLRLVLTPGVAAEGSVAVRGWIQRGTALEPWAVTPRIAPNGAALIEGTASALGLADRPPGRVTLVLAIGREASLPPVTAQAVELEAVGLQAGPFRVVRTEVELARP